MESECFREKMREPSFPMSTFSLCLFCLLHHVTHLYIVWWSNIVLSNSSVKGICNRFYLKEICWHVAEFGNVKRPDFALCEICQGISLSIQKVKSARFCILILFKGANLPS